APLAILCELQRAPAAGATAAGAASTAAAAAALAWIVCTPFGIALVLCRRPAAERHLARALALIVYPLFVAAWPLAMVGIDSAPPPSSSEAAPHPLPAPEILRASRPFVDIAPPHGLLSDGALEYLAMRTGHTAAGDLLRLRRTVKCANLAAIYA